MSDSIINNLIEAFQIVILAIISTIGGYMLAKIAKTSKQGHDLANNFMLEQKRKLMVATSKTAKLTRDDADKAIAEEALAAYNAHKEIDDRMKVVVGENIEEAPEKKKRK